MRGQEFLARLREEVVIGDGALGTLLSERGIGRETAYERLNLTHPEMISELHHAYVKAGADVLETNTFGANRTKLGASGPADEVSAINRAGVRLARDASGGRAFVAGAVGPLANRPGPHDADPLTEEEVREIFREPMIALAEAGADLLILETFTDLGQLLLALEVAKSSTDLPVVCQMAFHEFGHTHGGVHVTDAALALRQAGADVLGANCGRGVRAVVGAVDILTSAECLVSAYPNAGLPEYVDGRYLFGAPLPYLVESAAEMVARGVSLIGGCCGTTPAYVERIALRLKGRRPPRSLAAISADPPRACAAERAAQALPPAGSILEGLSGRSPHRPLVVVELDPPRGLQYEPVLRRARQLRDMGVDAITMADNPVATVRMGNMALAQIVQKTSPPRR